VIVLDACVLIAHLDANDAHHERATRLLASMGDLPLVASTLTVAEVLVGPTRASRGRQAQEALGRLGVTALELPADAADALADLRATTGLKMPDCCVLWTAIARQPAALATFDYQLVRAAESRHIPVDTGE
jgi:predicted nucleic acid-binding protein